MTDFQGFYELAPEQFVDEIQAAIADYKLVIAAIKSNHVIYHDVVSWIKNIGTTVGNFTFGMGEIIGAGLMTALTGWLKKSEFTADRAGLLACQDIDTATRALIKMALGSRKLFSQISIEGVGTHFSGKPTHTDVQ